MKLLEEKRDELADKNFNIIMSEPNEIENSNIRGYFASGVSSGIRIGFNAAVKELEPVLKELVEALTDAAEYDDTYIAWKALQKYKQLIGG